MLDRLPIELLAVILRLAAPLDYTPELYKERRATLRSCCLVSKRTHDLAQPMLPDVFVVEGEEDAEMLEPRAAGVRLLILRGEADVSPELNARVDLEATLRSLVVSGCYMSTRPPPLPALIELSLCGPRIHPPTLHTLLQPETIPSVRALGIANLWNLVSADNADLPFPPLSPALLSRLDLLCVDGHDEAIPYPSSTAPYREAFLLDSSMDDTAPVLDTVGSLSFVRLYHHLFSQTHDFDSIAYAEHEFRLAVAKLTAHLEEQPSSRPGCMIMPRERPSSDAADTTSMVIEEPARICAAHGVGVKWPERTPNWEYDSLISPVCWHRARRLKREKEKERESSIGRS